MNYNNLFITCDQLTNDIEVQMSFQVSFAYIIKEPLTEIDMSAVDTA